MYKVISEDLRLSQLGSILRLPLKFPQDPKNLPPGLPANLVNLIGKGSLAAVPTGNKLHTTEQPKPKPAPPPPPKVPEETPQQKQAAAKLALRQQLEKTLLQVRYQKCKSWY